MLVNVAGSNLNVNLHNPEKPYYRVNMHRVGPEVSINLKRGESIDLLPFYEGSLEKAHAAVKHSSDVLKLIRPTQLCVYVCDDEGKKIDVEKLLKPVEEAEKKDLPDATREDIEVSAMLASQDQFEAEKAGEANPPPSAKSDEEKAESTKLNTKAPVIDPDTPTMMKFKEEELKKMTRNDLRKLAKDKLKINISITEGKQAMIETILGAQVNV